MSDMDGGKYSGLDVEPTLRRVDQIHNVLSDDGGKSQYSVDHYGDRMDHNADHMHPDMYSYLNNMDEEELMRQYREYYEQGSNGYYPPDEGGDYYGDEYGYYGDEDGYYDDEYMRISVSELCDRCVIPTLGQALNKVYPLIGLCFVVRITVCFVNECELLLCLKMLIFKAMF